jgi:hypothetical protein
MLRAVPIVRGLAFAVALALASGEARASEPTASTSTTARNEAAVAAYDEGVALAQAREYDEAIAKLDYASELEPQWSAPVRARADVYATLAKKNKPSARFTAARADELERLVALEPGVETAARKHEIADLRVRAAKAAKAEARRRKLMAPAAVMITSSVGFLLAGVLLHSMKPTREALQPGAYRQERRDRAGIALMAIGGILTPPAIALGVLAFRQARHDGVVRDHDAITRRRPVDVAVAPQMLRKGGGLGISLRF